MDNVLPRLIEGSVVVVPADRTEVLLAVHHGARVGDLPVPCRNRAQRRVRSCQTRSSSSSTVLRPTLPIIASALGTYDTAVTITNIRPRLAADSQRKLDTALALFEQHVDSAGLLELLEVESTDVVTPLMFEYGLVERARANRKHIVLPEGDDDRILRAAATVLSRGIADLTILGEEIEVRARAIGLGVGHPRGAGDQPVRRRAAGEVRRRVHAAARPQGRQPGERRATPSPTSATSAR